MSGLVAAAMHHATRMEANALYYQAIHDILTGLPNRSLFFERLRNSLAHAGDRQERLALLNIDMDVLKAINDSHSHRTGDAAICAVASRISACVRQSDTAARLGGDEFAVILRKAPDRGAALGQAARITEDVAKPFSFEGNRLDLGISVGVSLYPDDGTNIADLIETADAAMYRDKKIRKSGS